MKNLLPASLVCCLALTSAAFAEDAAKPKSTLPVFNLRGSLSETPVGNDLPFGSAGGESLKDLVARLDKAAQDDKVKAVVVAADSAQAGRAQIEEIRAALARLKKADKKVYVHADSLSMSSLLLFANASRLSVVPAGDVWVTGLYGESLYVRGLLDRIGVTPDFLTCGKYKSAAEMFMRTAPSQEAAENLDWLFDGIFGASVDGIAEGRGVPNQQVRKWIDQGLYTAEEAKAAGIVDAVEYKQDFLAHIEKEVGEVEINKRYGKKKRKEIDFSSPFGVIQFYADLFSAGSRRESTQPAVAIVYVEGPIVPGSAPPESFPIGSGGTAYSTPIRKALEKAAADDSVKAVVLRVDSPGGSVVASEIILNATRRVKAKKPIVVSMGNVAGSGGYYVSCGADTIFADETTITGSIGVVGGKLATTNMWDRIGITWRPTRRGKNAAIFSSAATFSAAERDRLQGWMDEVYGVFKDHVVAIRGDRLKKDIDELAGGRVYTGKQALEFGLIDRIGGLSDAIQFAAKEADVEKYEVRVIPRTRDFFELLMRDLQDGGDDGDGQTISLTTAKSQSGVLDAALPLLRGLDPARVKSAASALRQLELLRKESVTLTMPILHWQP